MVEGRWVFIFIGVCMLMCPNLRLHVLWWVVAPLPYFFNLLSPVPSSSQYTPKLPFGNFMGSNISIVIYNVFVISCFWQMLSFTSSMLILEVLRKTLTHFMGYMWEPRKYLQFVISSLCSNILFFLALHQFFFL